MPANLPPQYHEAEKCYRQAKTTPEKIEALETMLSIMPKHKGTDKLRAEIRAKIAKLAEESLRRPFIGKKGSGYYIRKEGAGQVALVGLPNVGKSQLAAAITNAPLIVADYPFTTKVPSPGMARFENIQIQFIDLPPLTDAEARSWLTSVLRNADVLLLVVDLSHDPVAQLETIFTELRDIRLKPIGRESEEAEPGIIQKRALIVGNKNDLTPAEENYQKLNLQYKKDFRLVSISAATGTGLEDMKREIYEALNIIRVYTKAPGQRPDKDDPVVLEKGSTVIEMATSIHKDFASKLKYAQVWGSGKYDGQRVKRDYILEDGDIVELHL